MKAKQPKILVISRKDDKYIKEFFAGLTNYKTKVNTNQTAEITFDNSYAVVFICRNDLEEFRLKIQTIKDYLANGGNLVVLGEGLNQRSFNYGCQFNEITGLKPVSYLQEGMQVHIENPEHPIMRDVEDFELSEKLITYEQVAEFCSVLMEGSAEEQYSVIAQVNPNGGRTVSLALGRSPKTWEHPMFARIITNLLNYCAYGEYTSLS